ncbi:MAG: hypothetical protein IJW76_00210 [Clostridia bacterium]|nr:hypothetical protein [Clostridia bacterium]
MTRKNANKITTILSVALLAISLAAITVGIIEAVMKTGGVLVTVSLVALIINAVLIVALPTFVIATRNAKDEVVAATPAPAEEAPAEEPAMEEETILLVENVDEEALAEAVAAPTVELTRIDYIDEEDEEYEDGVEVISVVWPERAHKNKLYRYSPNGQKFTADDHVLVPTKDAAQNKEVIRKATVVHGNHKIDPEHLNYPLKNIIGIVKAKEEAKK